MISAASSTVLATVAPEPFRALRCLPRLPRDRRASCYPGVWVASQGAAWSFEKLGAGTPR